MLLVVVVVAPALILLVRGRRSADRPRLRWTSNLLANGRAGMLGLISGLFGIFGAVSVSGFAVPACLGDYN